MSDEKAVAGNVDPYNLKPTRRFDEIPPEILRQPWKVCGRARWKRLSNSIPELEFHAALFGLRHLLRNTANHNKTLLMLSDSMTTVAIFGERAVQQRPYAASLSAGVCPSARFRFGAMSAVAAL